MFPYEIIINLGNHRNFNYIRAQFFCSRNSDSQWFGKFIDSFLPETRMQAWGIPFYHFPAVGRNFSSGFVPGTHTGRFGMWREGKATSISSAFMHIKKEKLFHRKFVLKIETANAGRKFPPPSSITIHRLLQSISLFILLTLSWTELRKRPSKTPPFSLEIISILVFSTSFSTYPLIFHTCPLQRYFSATTMNSKIPNFKRACPGTYPKRTN